MRVAILSVVVLAAVLAQSPAETQARIVASFDLCLGDDGYDQGVDFNADGCVDLVDWSIFATALRSGH